MFCFSVNTASTTNRENPRRALEDLIQGSGVRGRKFGSGSDMFEARSEYLETQEKGDKI